MVITWVIGILSFLFLTLKVIQTGRKPASKTNLQAIICILGWVILIGWVAYGIMTTETERKATAMMMEFLFIVLIVIEIRTLATLEKELPKNHELRKAQRCLEKLEFKYELIKDEVPNTSVERVIQEITSLIKAYKESAEITELTSKLAGEVFPQYVKIYFDYAYTQMQMSDDEIQKFYAEQLTECTDDFLRYIAVVKDNHSVQEG